MNKLQITGETDILEMLDKGYILKWQKIRKGNPIIFSLERAENTPENTGQYAYYGDGDYRGKRYRDQIEVMQIVNGFLSENCEHEFISPTAKEETATEAPKQTYSSQLKQILSNILS